MKQKIIQKIEQQIEAGIYPGASFAYYRDGEWSDCYLGEANPEIGEQTRQGLVYDLASVSKVVGVGTVLTFLWKQGKIEIDQSIKTYLQRRIIQISPFVNSSHILRTWTRLLSIETS